MDTVSRECVWGCGVGVGVGVDGGRRKCSRLYRGPNNLVFVFSSSEKVQHEF